MKAIRKSDGLVFDLSEFVYDTNGNEYQWDEVTLIPSKWNADDLNHLRQYTASQMMTGMMNGIMQSTLLMGQYKKWAAREGKTLVAIIASDAVDYADALIDEFVKRGKRVEP